MLFERVFDTPNVPLPVAPCSQFEYENIRYRVMFGTNCTKFCHCAYLTTNDDGSVEYYWEQQPCAPGTRWDGLGLNGTCLFSNDVQCLGKRENYTFFHSALNSYMYIDMAVVQMQFTCCTCTFTLLLKTV